MVDENGIGWMVNPAYTALTGLKPEEVIGKPATVDIDPTQESMHLQVLRTRQPVRNVPLRVGPRKREVVVNVAPILVDGKLKGSVGVVRDVSEIARLSAELEQHRKLLRRASLLVHVQRDHRRQPGDAPGGGAGPPGRPDPGDRAAPGRERHGQGAGRARDPRRIERARHEPFVAVNCARACRRDAAGERAVRPREGRVHRRATRAQAGLFEAADGGTLFLDEVGEMPLALQAKLLRVLQEREIAPRSASTRAGAGGRAGHRRHQPRPARRWSRGGTFREDLYYRLNVVPDPAAAAARARPEDIPLLARHFAREARRGHGRSVPRTRARRAAACCGLPLAGQRAGAGERRRAGR